VKGACDDFTECFVDEGNSDPFQVMLTLKRVGFNGFMIDDHVPRMVNDSAWHHRGRAFATGYLLGLLRAVNAITEPAPAA